MLSTVYTADKKLSTLKVLRSYEHQLIQSGFEILYSCDAEVCGRFLLKEIYKSPSRKKQLIGLDHWYNYNSTMDWRFLSARKAVGGKNAFAIIIVAYPINSNTPRILVEVMEEEVFQPVPITSGIKQLSDDIGAAGSAVLHGIYFDSDSAVLTERLDQALSVIADYLKANEQKRYLVVGHTDVSGDVDKNMSLSKLRAEAVLRELIATHGVAKEQLLARGVGPAAPKSTNVTKEGRALNRRVELVALSFETDVRENEPWLGKFGIDQSKLDPNDKMTAVLVAAAPKFSIQKERILIAPDGASPIEAKYSVQGNKLLVHFPQGDKFIVFNDDFSGFILEGGKSGYVRIN